MTPSADLEPIESLKDKTLLYVGCRLFLTTDEDIPKSPWVALRKMGIKSIVVVLQKSPVNTRCCKKLKAMGIIDEYNVDGLIQEKKESRPVEEVANDIIAWLKETNIEVNAACIYGDYMGVVGGYLCEALGVPWNSYASMKAAFMKDVTQDMVLKEPKAAKYGVPSYAVKTEKELLVALDKMKFPVVMKPVCGSGSVGCKVLYDAGSCQEFFAEVTHGLNNGTAACEKITYSQSVVVMEYLHGTKYTADVAISNGKLIGGAIAERGPAVLPYFYATSLTLPGNVNEDEHRELVESAYQCCMAVGLRNGVYDVDLIRDQGAMPKLIEINPRPGGNCMTDLMKAVYGQDLFLMNLLMCCGVEMSADSVELQPRTNACAYLMYLSTEGEKLKRAFGYILSMARDNDVAVFDAGWETTARMLYNRSKRVRPACVLMTSSQDSRGESIQRLARFLVDTTYFDSMADAMERF